MAGWRNLSQSEAAERSRLLEVTAYDISLDLTDGAGGPGSGTFASTTTVTFTCAEPGTNSFIEVAAERLRSAALNGVPLDTSCWSADTGLPLPSLAARNTLTIAADFAYSTASQGLHRAVDPADDAIYLYTSFEPNDAQRVFACFDQPDLKSVFTWRVRVPDGWQAISNMAEERTEPHDGGGRTVHFATSARMSTYVTALCAGPYHRVRGEHDGIELGLYCRASVAHLMDTDFLFDITRRGFDHFHKHFGVRYPLPKYDQVFVPEYQKAMENFGCVTYGDLTPMLTTGRPTESDLNWQATVMLHEMAHMWFGDLCTMSWWDDLWLNESFATWASYAALADIPRFADTAWSSMLTRWKIAAYQADQLSSTHPVYCEIPDVAAVHVNFDRITYGKGAAVLKQLVAYVGLDGFTAGLNRYFTRHAFANTTFDDLLDAVQATSGRDVRGFAEQWLRTAQVNTLRTETAEDDGRYGSVTISQQAPAGYPTLRTHQLLVGAYALTGDGRLSIRDRSEVTVRDARTPVPALAGSPVADLLLPNDGDLSYAKLRLDDRSWATMLTHLSDLDDLLARTLCWQVAWDMVRDGELPARSHLRLVATALPAEPDMGLVGAVAQQAQTALTQYTDPAWVEPGWQLLAETAARGLDRAEPASGLQQTWAGAYAAAARSGADLTLLRDWLAGSGVPAGLNVDSNLRWRALQTLVALGAAGVADIDAEQDRDRTSSGQFQAATARALLPGEEAKSTAWARVAIDAELPLHVRLATLVGFQHPAQTALTRPYAERYFDTVERVWQRLSPDAASAFATRAYPVLQVDDEVLDMAQRWLAGDGHPPPLRRLVGNGRDETVRGLHARSADHAAG